MKRAYRAGTLNAAAIAEKFQTMFDVIASEQGRVVYMFDVIVNDARKYAPDARKPKAKPDQCFGQPDVITILQITTERRAVKTPCEFNVQRRIHVRHGQNRERLKQNTLNFAEIFINCNQNFLAFAENF